MTAPTVQDAAARRRADVAARTYELAAQTAVVAAVLTVVAGILAPVLAAYAAGRPRVYVWGLQVAAASALRRWRPRVSALLSQVVARGRPGSAPAAAGDTTLRHTLATVDAAVQAAVDQVVEQLGRPLLSDADAEALRGKVDAVQRTVQRHVARVANRTVALEAIGGGGELVWAAERDACLHCLAYSGQTVTAGGLFTTPAGFDPHPLPWSADGVDGPPLHDHCRCRLVPATALNVAALRREAERSVVRGFSAYASVPESLRAVAKLLDRKTYGPTRLPKSVRERGERDLRRGAFSARHKTLLPGLGR